MLAPATESKQTDDKAADAPARAFVAGSRERTQPFHDRSTQLGSSGTQVGPEDVTAFGFLRHLVVFVEATGGAAGAATVAANEDAPFSVLDDVTLHDVNGNPIVRLSGYELYLANKWGAYNFLTDPKQRPSYEAVDADGNFGFLLRIPVQVSGRDGFGSLVNQNAGQTYKMTYTLAGAAQVYDTAPDTLPTVRTRAWLEAWTPPRSAGTDGAGFKQAPPAHGSVQFWRRFPVNIEAGAQTIRLPHVGNHIRTIVAALRSDGSRSTEAFPDPVQLHIDGNVLDNIARPFLRDRMAERYGFDAAEDAPGGLDAGVMVWDFQHDLDGKAGFETRDGYLATTQATNLELSGTFGASGVLTILTNDVAVLRAS